MAGLLLTLNVELDTWRDPYRLEFSHYLFFLPGLCVSAAGFAIGLVAYPLARQESESHWEAVIGIGLSILALWGLAAVRLLGGWFVGAC